MKCLGKYKWIKLYRAVLPKVRESWWARRAGRAAFRQGKAQYCGHTNAVTPGMWSGGIVGLNSILGVKRRSQALQIMNELQSLGYISYNLEAGTKKLSYEITDWVQKYSGSEAGSGTVYATEGFGFICTPQSYYGQTSTWKENI